MKRVLFVLFCLISASLTASVKIRISDPNTLEPIDHPEVMVGSRVSLVVEADANDFWSGGFFIKGEDRAIGRLQAKGKDPNSRDWAGSHLSLAGPGGHVLAWKDSLIWGYDMYPDDFQEERYPGKWFVIDYDALDEGICTVGVYDHASDSWKDPNSIVTFYNTPSRDLKPDGVVNFADFQIFASYWQAADCSDPNKACHQADFSNNGSVGLEDVAMFADFWLHGTPGWKPAQPQAVQPAEPNTVDPNYISDIVYAIVDVNGLSEITLEVGESVELYITKSSIDDEVYIFNAEVTISDPNLGWIDNRSGTAEILVMPRIDFFDVIAPGSTQPEGLEFMAVNLAPLADGDMARFYYTATEPNDVVLNLINYSTGGEQLVPITIHQVKPVIQTLQQIYDENPDLQMEVSEPEWNEFIQTVEQSQ